MKPSLFILNDNMNSTESSLNARIHMPGAPMSRTKSHYEKQSVFINHIINHNLITFGRNILIERAILLK